MARMVVEPMRLGVSSVCTLTAAPCVAAPLVLVLRSVAVGTETPERRTGYGRHGGVSSASATT